MLKRLDDEFEASSADTEASGISASEAGPREGSSVTETAPASPQLIADSKATIEEREVSEVDEDELTEDGEGSVGRVG